MSVDVQDLIQTTLLGEAAENAPLGVFVADEEMRYVAANRYACALLGYTREELLSLRVPDVTSAPGLEERYRRMIAEGALSGRSRMRRKDRVEVDVEVDAFSTKVAQMTVYVAFIRPAPPA